MFFNKLTISLSVERCYSLPGLAFIVTPAMADHDSDVVPVLSVPDDVTDVTARQ